MIRLPQAGEQDCADHACQQQEIPFAVNFDFLFGFGRSRDKVFALFTMKMSAVDDVENGQQNYRTDQHRHQHMFDGPHEIYAFQES